MDTGCLEMTAQICEISESGKEHTHTHTRNNFVMNLNFIKNRKREKKKRPKTLYYRLVAMPESHLNVESVCINIILALVMFSSK